MKEVPRGDPFESRLKPLWTLAQDGDESAYRASLAMIAIRLLVFFVVRCGR